MLTEKGYQYNLLMTASVSSLTCKIRYASLLWRSKTKIRLPDHKKVDMLLLFVSMRHAWIDTYKRVNAQR